LVEYRCLRSCVLELLYTMNGAGCC
jgi:hypothetical protein